MLLDVIVTLCTLLKVVTSGKNSRGYHYILANLVRASNNTTHIKNSTTAVLTA